MEVTSDDGLLEHLVDIEVLPLLARSFCDALECKLILLLSDHFQGNRVVYIVGQVALGQGDQNRCVWHNLADLSRPPFHIGV